MNRILDFILRMDARAARAVGVSVALFAMVGIVFLMGRFVLDLEPGAASDWFADMAGRWYALPVTILVFTALSFLGAPQFGLMAAAIVAFGPVMGSLYAWIATLVAASVNFILGRLFGARILKRYGGDWANRISSFIGRNGLLASMVVRWVPSGPFIVVNMGFGIARTPYWAFALGTALGTAPKIVVVGLAGQSILAMLTEGKVLLGLALLVAVAAWIGIMLVARKWLRRNRDKETSEEPA
ncbi:VTT domain-containing protein [Maricaulis sp.]|uniref:TVP38/TMEM64 family protein n=1 Tax=Maricaulis sp. TaxID=1486257 RepID=UPI0026255028|nr:VTT domain-containing protein [Maricaulis sp.]